MKHKRTLRYNWQGPNSMTLTELDQILVEARNKQVPGSTKLSMVSGMGYNSWHVSIEYDI